MRPLACYFVWQAIYNVKTEALDKETIAADPEIITCQRWISSSPSWLKHPFVRWCGAVLTNMRLYRRSGGEGEGGALNA